MKTVAQKMGIKANSRSIFINAPEDAIISMELPDIERKKTLTGAFDYIHLFVTSAQEQRTNFSKLKQHLELQGVLWVSWPKNRQLGSDLTLREVVNIGYSFGLVESTCLSINSVWSALKFTHPKEDKVYNNSHAVLKNRTTGR